MLDIYRLLRSLTYSQISNILGNYNPQKRKNKNILVNKYASGYTLGIKQVVLTS